jgi:hypothetical protein
MPATQFKHHHGCIRCPVNATVATHLRGDQVHVVVNNDHRAHRQRLCRGDGEGATKDGPPTMFRPTVESYERMSC